MNEQQAEPDLPQAWIEFGATLIYDLHRAGILDKLDDLSDEEIFVELEKVREKSYNRAVKQTPRVAPERPTSYAGLESAPPK